MRQFFRVALAAALMVTLGDSQAEAGAGKDAGKDKVDKASKVEKEKKDKADKEKGGDRFTAYEKAMVEAKAFDKEHAAEMFVVEVPVSNLRYFKEDATLERKADGPAKVGEGLSLRSTSEVVYAKGPEDELKQEKKGFRVYLSTRYKKEGLDRLNECRKLASEALNNRGLLVVSGQFKRHRVLVSEAELLRHWGIEKYKARLHGIKLSKEQRSVKNYMKSLGDESHIRGGIHINVDSDEFKCELADR
jgi:hypothetical protein